MIRIGISAFQVRELAIAAVVIFAMMGMDRAGAPDWSAGIALIASFPAVVLHRLYLPPPNVSGVVRIGDAGVALRYLRERLASH